MKFLAASFVLMTALGLNVALAGDACQGALTAEAIESFKSLFLLSRMQPHLDLAALLKTATEHPEQVQGLIEGWQQEALEREAERSLRELYLQAKAAGSADHELWIAAFAGMPDRIRTLLAQWDTEAPVAAPAALKPPTRAENPATAVTIDQALRRRMQALISAQIVDQIPTDLRIFEYRPFAAGSFTFGSDRNDLEREEHEQLAGPHTQVSVSAFEMGNHIPQWVVNLWRMETGKLRDGDKLLLSLGRYQSQSDGDFVDLGDGITMNANHPGTNISYDESLKFVAWWNAIPEIHEAGCIYNLPTQVQWEYAARYLGPGNISHDSRPFPAAELGDRAWVDRVLNDRTHAIGLKLPHPNGLFDVFGNAWVWTLDSVNLNDCQVMPTLQLGTNDLIVSVGSCRVVRGGVHSQRGCMRSPARRIAAPEYRGEYVSLRLVRVCP